MLPVIGPMLAGLLGLVKNIGLFVAETLKNLIEDVAAALPHGTVYKGGIFKRGMQLEGTHNYGDKPMSFFWPIYGVTSRDIVNYTVEDAIATDKPVKGQKIDFSGRDKTDAVLGEGQKKETDGIDSKYRQLNDSLINNINGELTSLYVGIKGVEQVTPAPFRTGVVEGVTSFLSKDVFKNEQVGMPKPVFPPPPIHDYNINEKWNLGFNAIGGEVISVSCDDTKILDGAPSNIVIKDEFCGVASSYTAIEIKDYFDEMYLRPIAVTPTAVALNINKHNVVHNAKSYHGFDGIGNRIISWTGGAGMNKTFLFQQYLFQVNDHFKRSSIQPPSQFLGNFKGPPTVYVKGYDRVANIVQSLTQEQGMDNNVPGENKSLQRYSIPIHSESLSTLPAVVRTIAPYKLNVVEGVTTLTTDLRNTQTAYKAPTSVDFNISGFLYRATEEYICTIGNSEGINNVQDVVASAGLTFIGATTKEAFFYSEATRMYYKFDGGRELTKQDILNRFATVTTGRWDFVNQEVMFKALFTGNLIDDKMTILRLDSTIHGEVYPPPPTVYNERSDFRLHSTAGGTVNQGPLRFTVSRFIILDNMFEDIRNNKGKWNKLDREYFNIERYFGWDYKDIETYPDPDKPIVKGWTHNPFRLATAMLGIDESTDCKFEWVMTFAWTDQMDQLFAQNEFVCVNLAAETVTEGGTVLSDVTHVYLFKECFTRSGNAGYYTFKFQSNNGIGNRERLYMWSDGIIAIEELKLNCKNITTSRTQPLHTQVDLTGYKEL
jgi:hypothetical protein